MQQENAKAQAAIAEQYRMAVENTERKAEEHIKAARHSVETSAKQQYEQATKELNDRLAREAQRNLELSAQVETLTYRLQEQPAPAPAAGGDGQDPNRPTRRAVLHNIFTEDEHDAGGGDDSTSRNRANSTAATLIRPESSTNYSSSWQRATSSK